MREFTIEGKMYCQIYTTFIYVCTHNLTHFQSLVDRGANGGVVGEDVPVINTSPNMHIKPRGIDNHKITSVLIDTVGALDNSQAGPVIIIMHQYEYNGNGKNIH